MSKGRQQNREKSHKGNDCNEIFQGRGSGVLLHVSALPNPYGVGDLGQSARKFLDFLVGAEQSYWQFLPLVPTCGVFGHSPYSSFSAFAGNPLFIDPQGLVDDGLLNGDDLSGASSFSEYLVDFEAVQSWKKGLFRQAFSAFELKGDTQSILRFQQIMPWLEDYALFMALRNERAGEPWHAWPDGLVHRLPEAMQAARKRLAHEIRYHIFEQYCFFQQLNRLRGEAESRGIKLIGDLPIYVSFDSVDVWAHKNCFLLDPETCQPLSVAGVPPDYFSDTGQRWGNPLYRWNSQEGEQNKPLVHWWRERFRQTFRMMDIVRLDHFRGFESFWEIPAVEETAINGRWVKGPGKKFFDGMKKELGPMPIIAEDLGVITPEVEKLRDSMGFPGMKILQFAFDSDADNLYLPHNYTSTNCIVYTGTHDNDTVVGWQLSPEVAESSKEKAKRYANYPSSNEVHWDFIRMAFSSIASVAIIPLQDVLGFGGDCRFNKPSTSNGNWLWRCAPRFLSEAVQNRLADETRFYGRGRTGFSKK